MTFSYAIKVFPARLCFSDTWQIRKSNESTSLAILMRKYIFCLFFFFDAQFVRQKLQLSIYNLQSYLLENFLLPFHLLFIHHTAYSLQRGSMHFTYNDHLPLETLNLPILFHSSLLHLLVSIMLYQLLFFTKFYRNA